MLYVEMIKVKKEEMVKCGLMCFFFSDDIKKKRKRRPIKLSYLTKICHGKKEKFFPFFEKLISF